MVVVRVRTVVAGMVGLAVVLAVQRQAIATLSAKNGDLRESNRQKDAANLALAEAKRPRAGPLRASPRTRRSRKTGSSRCGTGC